jgi:D-glycero-D-manno-heptose 1,7-bisphosphate phosphatase
MAAKAKDAAPMRPGFTVFLDRDGVFNVHPKLAVRQWKDFVWLPGVQAAFAKLNRPDVRTCLATNQPTVGLLLSTRGMIERVNANMAEELADAGGRLDRIEAAFAPTYVKHRRRKPRPGMLEDGALALAANGWPVDTSRAVMIGDNLKDAAAGNTFGVPGILLATTHDREYLQAGIERHGLDAVVVDGLPAAIEIVLARIDRSA